MSRKGQKSGRTPAKRKQQNFNNFFWIPGYQNKQTASLTSLPLSLPEVDPKDPVPPLTPSASPPPTLLPPLLLLLLWLVRSSDPEPPEPVPVDEPTPLKEPPTLLTPETDAAEEEQAPSAVVLPMLLAALLLRARLLVLLASEGEGEGLALPWWRWLLLRLRRPFLPRWLTPAAFLYICWSSRGDAMVEDTVSRSALPTAAASADEAQPPFAVLVPSTLLLLAPESPGDEGCREESSVLCAKLILLPPPPPPLPLGKGDELEEDDAGPAMFWSWSCNCSCNLASWRGFAKDDEKEEHEKPAVAATWLVLLMFPEPLGSRTCCCCPGEGPAVPTPPTPPAAAAVAGIITTAECGVTCIGMWTCC